MDVTPISFTDAAPLDETASEDDVVGLGDFLARRWQALHEAAAVVAALAGVPAVVPAEARAFPRRVPQGEHWRRDLAEQGVEDLAAIMEPGLSALIAVHSGGQDVTAPARALWQEFVAARDALVGLVPQH